MLRYFFLLCLSSMFLFGVQDKPLFDEYRTKLELVHKNRATITDSPKIQIGSSGVVVHRFGEISSTIIAKATVVSKDGKKALVELVPYDALQQETFPKAVLIPDAGDEIYLNYLYNRPLIIAPNYETFSSITNNYIAFDWIHPDILAAYLAKEHIPNPDKDKFRQICNYNLAGLIMFAIEDKGYFVDCTSFKTIKTIEIEKVEDNEIILPFYSRISSNVKDSWFVWEGSSISSYNEHYKMLLGIE